MAAPAYCLRGCGEQTYNGQPNEYCSKTCREQTREEARAGTLPPPLQGMLQCPRLGCGGVSYSLKPGDFCSRTCKDAPEGPGGPAVLGIHPPRRQRSSQMLSSTLLTARARASGQFCRCGQPLQNGGSDCPRCAIQALVGHSPMLATFVGQNAAPQGPGPRCLVPVPGCGPGPRCLVPGCGKPTYNGRANEFCGETCRLTTGTPTTVCSQLLPADRGYQDIMQQFGKWDSQKMSQKTIQSIWRVHACQQVQQRFNNRCNAIGNVKCHGRGKNPGNVHRRFHGTSLACTFRGTPCPNPACNVCSILQNGFDIRKLGQGSGNVGFYGPGHYSTSMPATAAGYGGGNAILVVNVAVGTAEIVTQRTSNPVPPGFDSRVVDKTTNVDELLVPQDDQMLPTYLIVFT